MEIWLLLTVVGMVPSAAIMPSAINKTPLVALEGSSVDLHCCVGTDSGPHRCRVYWFFNSDQPSQTGLRNLSNKMFNNCSNASPLTLQNVTRKDSGWYYCKGSIEIPFLKQCCSNWTQLVVNLLNNMPTTYKPTTFRPTSHTGVIEKGKPQENPPFVWSDWWVWIAVGASGLVLVILLIVCLVLRRRQLRRRDVESPVYANMHRVNGSRQPSPQVRPGANNTLKTESPYQNLRTPEVNKRYEHSRRLAPNR